MSRASTVEDDSSRMLRQQLLSEPKTGVPQLIALLAHVPTQNPCSEAFGLVRISKRHRYTFRVEVLAN